MFYLGCEQYKTKSDLVNGKCPTHQVKPKLIREESYLFRLSKLKNILEKKIKKDELKIRPEKRKNEVLEFLRKGLQDISIENFKLDESLISIWELAFAINTLKERGPGKQNQIKSL
ncbi:MAG: class I tRNA ligase family protein [Patescibacteria group bacterium]|nr:class I tRNA ligase family protein [Patescibacteria group bacterium]